MLMNFKTEKPLLIVLRLKPRVHWEYHYLDRVDFVTPTGEKMGSSKVEESAG